MLPLLQIIWLIALCLATADRHILKIISRYNNFSAFFTALSRNFYVGRLRSETVPWKHWFLQNCICKWQFPMDTLDYSNQEVRPSWIVEWELLMALDKLSKNHDSLVDLKSNTSILKCRKISTLKMESYKHTQKLFPSLQGRHGQTFTKTACISKLVTNEVKCYFRHFSVIINWLTNCNLIR